MLWRRIRSSNLRLILLWLWLLAIAAVVFAAMEVNAAPVAQGDAAMPHAAPITYQGRLQQNGSAAGGTYDFMFHLFDAADGGNSIGPAVTVDDVLLDDGYFTVELDFGPAAFDGRARYLAIQVRPGDQNGSYTTLAPRQQLTAAPLALALPGFHSTAVSTTFNVHAGTISNTIDAGAIGAWVGGYDAAAPNRVTDHYGMVLGGANNYAGDHDNDPDTTRNALIVGGVDNTNGGTLSAIVTGRGNIVEDGAGLSFIGGGRGNRAGLALATIAGGLDNVAIAQGAGVLSGRENKATDEYSTIGGGISNRAGNGDGNPFNVTAATVAGGSFNSALASAAFVGGGSNNDASGIGAVVVGGLGNTAAGAHSFAGGKDARAMGDGSFVWSDGTAVFTSTLPHQFWVKASGGVLFDTGNAGVVLNPGSGTWASISDRHAKENFAPVDVWAVLEAVAELPLTTWNYKTQSPEVRHLGPMAQDFYAAFQLGDDDRHISTVDADGVALAAIQALYAHARTQEAQIAALQIQHDELAARVAALESRLAALQAAQQDEMWSAQQAAATDTAAMHAEEAMHAEGMMP